jgi:hypothetical protein
MQLIIRLLILLLLAVGLFAQDSNTGDTKPVEIDFLLDYYQQDGDHAATTGGTGTEKLMDIAPLIIINIPVHGDNQINFSGGVDVYTSASSDNIDPSWSGASGQDVRGHANLGYTFNNKESASSYGFTLGGSAEFDYRSFSVGANWAQGFNDDNSEIALQAQALFDNITLIAPYELRPPGYSYGSDSRTTYNFSLTFSQVLSRRAQASLNVQGVVQKGYLGTPFHRVYFRNRLQPKVENLPDNRFKLPASIRFNYYLSDLVVLRTYYRYYSDDFGVRANTFNIETPLRVSPSITIGPFFRYHVQGAADYFAPYKEHELDEEFYTSDYDLSAFNSRKFGLSFRYYPLMGLGKTRLDALKKELRFKKIELRAGVFQRSDGLKAFSVSTGFSFEIY